MLIAHRQQRPIVRLKVEPHFEILKEEHMNDDPIIRPWEDWYDIGGEG
jgi:hypothetical protein